MQEGLFLLLLSFLEALCASDPTDGFTRVSLAAQNLKLQIPYDKSPADRYSKVDGVERFWVYTNDKPFKQGSPTRPRTEIRISGYDYTSGVWQFEGNFYVPQGSSGVIIMQIHGEPTEATTLQQRVYNGDLKYYIWKQCGGFKYLRQMAQTQCHSQCWWWKGHGQANFYFKYGVYGAFSASSNYMESRWEEVKLFKK